MLKFFSLSSGSCGNCYYLGSEERGIIIDAGVSLRRLSRFFKDNGISPDAIEGILITHAHLDHIKFLGTFCKKLHKPVYTTETIGNALSRHPFTAGIIGAYRKTLEEGVETDLSGIGVRCFEVPHDAVQTVGYAIDFDGHKFMIATDIGQITDDLLKYASQAQTLVLESNYDKEMLLSGSYTYELKMRIIQGSGHLSNTECAEALKRVFHPELRNIFLCHLSENNNTPELAYRASSEALAGIGVEKGTVHLRCLPRSYPSPVFFLQD